MATRVRTMCGNSAHEEKGHHSFDRASPSLTGSQGRLQHAASAPTGNQTSLTRLSHAPQYHLTKGARESSVHAGKGEKRENGAAVNAEAAGWAGASQMCGQEGGAPGAGRGTARPSGVYAVGRSHCKKRGGGRGGGEGARDAAARTVRRGGAARRDAALGWTDLRLAGRRDVVRLAGRVCVLLPAGRLRGNRDSSRGGRAVGGRAPRWARRCAQRAAAAAAATHQCGAGGRRGGARGGRGGGRGGGRRVRGRRQSPARRASGRVVVVRLALRVLVRLPARGKRHSGDGGGGGRGGRARGCGRGGSRRRRAGGVDGPSPLRLLGRGLCRQS
jgi:hypothetical protein